MTKIDLITGFLGAGKTTFIRYYVNYLLEQGEKICILENDYGAINVDALLLSDLENKNVEIEMVAGGCDSDCHRRRFKTKLITLAMMGFTRVIVEPSGIYDVDEFFDILHEAPVDRMYHIENIITIVKASLQENPSLEERYLLASQAATAGCILLSQIDEGTPFSAKEFVPLFLNQLNESLTAIKCRRQFTENEILSLPWKCLGPSDFEKISHCGYHPDASFEKNFSIDENGFEALFFMNIRMESALLLSRIAELFHTPAVGHVIRAKGFCQTAENQWLEINALDGRIRTVPVANGQDVLIVIGEHLQKEELDSYFNARYSSCRLR